MVGKRYAPAYAILAAFIVIVCACVYVFRRRSTAETVDEGSDEGKGEGSNSGSNGDSDNDCNTGDNGNGDNNGDGSNGGIGDGGSNGGNGNGDSNGGGSNGGIGDGGSNGSSGNDGKCRVVQSRSPNGQLIYASGRVCNDATATVKCSTETRDRTHTYKWQETQEHVFKHWPVEIYDTRTGVCRPAALDDSDNGRIFAPNLRIDMPWTAAMREAHPFSPLTRQYDCSGTGAKYRWDYENRSVVTLSGGKMFDPSKEFVDTGAPCQQSAVPLGETRWGLAGRPLMFPDTEMPLLVAERFHRSLFPDFIAWPRRLDSGVVAFDTMDWSYQDFGFSVTRYEADTPQRMPIGFVEDPRDKVIRLRGFGARVWELLDDSAKETYAISTIATGRFDRVRFHDDDAENAKFVKTTQRYTSTHVLDLRKSNTYCFALPFVYDEVLIGDKFAKLTPSGVEIYEQMYIERAYEIRVEKLEGENAARITISGREDHPWTVLFDPPKLPYIMLRDGPIPAA